MTEYVLGFPFGKRKGRPAVLLVRKTSPKWQAGKLNGIGGHIERGEMAVAAMAREMQEETGLIVEEHEWEHRLTMQGSDWVVYVYRTEIDNLYLARQTTDRDKPVICEIDALPENVLSNLRWIVPLLLDKEAPTAEVIYPSFISGVSSKPHAEN